MKVQKDNKVLDVKEKLANYLITEKGFTKVEDESNKEEKKETKKRYKTKIMKAD